MNLKNYKLDNDYDNNIVLVDAESMLLSVLLSEKYFGKALNQKGFSKYQNAVAQYFAKKQVPVHFTYLDSFNEQLILDKAVGFRDDEEVVLEDNEYSKMVGEALKSPCINTFFDEKGLSFQLCKDIMKEKEQPDIYNAAIKKWAGNPYYVYLLTQIAPECTINIRLRTLLSDCALEFEESLDEIECSKYFEERKTNCSKMLPKDQKDDPAEQNAQRFYNQTVQAAKSLEVVQ